MAKNEDFKYLYLDLPEDIRRLKTAGHFKSALQLIHARLKADKLPVPLRHAYEAQLAIMEQLPKEYPYTKDEALAVVREHIPDFTEKEFDERRDAGTIDWIYVEGEKKYFGRFFDSLCKTDSALAKRAHITVIGADGAGERLDELIAEVEEKGEVKYLIHAKESVRLKDEYFTPGMKVRTYLPLPCKVALQSDIKVLKSSPKPTDITPEDAPQRVIYWEEIMQENHPFTVEFSYVTTIKKVELDPKLAVKVENIEQDKKVAEEYPCYLEEQLPHVRFTPYLKALTEDICKGKTNNLEKARAIYDYITLNVRYSFMPAYLCLENIAENCALNLRGDCGVQALLFITMCRIAGVPARWQSGWKAEKEFCGAHDWAQFYAAPWGWLYADPSFGGGAVREHNEMRRRYYFGHLDNFRMIANTAFQGEFLVPKDHLRCDPYDNQVGEMETENQPFNYDAFIRTKEVLECKEI